VSASPHGLVIAMAKIKRMGAKRKSRRPVRRYGPKVDRDWRHRLEKGDQAELLKWVEQSGLERVSRIIAALTDATGKRGPPEKLDTLLLLKMAHLNRQQPNRTLHAIAVEVAREAFSDRRAAPLLMESLVSKLERDFRRQRHTWTTRAGSTPPPSRESISQDASRSKSSNEFRVRARISGLLPSALDLYERLLADAKKLGPDEIKLVKALRRERAEPLLSNAIKRQSTSSFVMNAQGVAKIPRNFFDLIEPELERFRLNRPKRRPVGRK
jgi:hypothetical protein